MLLLRFSSPPPLFPLGLWTSYAVATGKKKETVPAAAKPKRTRKATAKKAAKPDNGDDGQHPASESDAFSGDGENDIDDNTWDPLA